MAILTKSSQLKKELSLFNTYTIATGATIASGFFLLPGIAYAQAGPAMILSYLIAAVPVIPALLSISELSTAMPRAGGVYFFLDRSMGTLMGTIGGLGTWLALTLKTAFALVGIGAYMSLFIPGISMLPLSIGFAVFFGIINILGAKQVGAFQGVLVTGLLSLLAIFAGLGVVRMDSQNFAGFFDSDMHSVFSTAGLVYVSYIGLSKIASVSEEVKNPEKNIPLAMFLALGTAILVYAVGTVIIIGTVPGDLLRNDLTPVATSAEIMVGRWGSIIMTMAAILAFFSVANAGIMSSSRYPLAMSRDHLLPNFFRTFSKRKTPKYAVLTSVLSILLILILFDPQKIAQLAGAFQLLLFALVSVAVIVMRESRLVSYDPGFRSPLYPWMQIFGVMAPVWLIYKMGWIPFLFTFGLIAIGMFWYFYYVRGKVPRTGAIYHVFERLGRRQYEGLDSELRGILKEKGLRDQDPFNAVVANAGFLDIDESASFEGVVARASQMLAQRVKADSGLLQRTFMNGTQVGATPVSHGAALPHLRLHNIDHSELIIVRCLRGVPMTIESILFNQAPQEETIYAFFFLASPEENPSQHLRILAQIASRIDSEDFFDNWRIAKNEQELKEVLLRDDRYISLRLEQETPTAEFIAKEIRDIPLPEGSLVALIHRNGEMIIPRETIKLHENDSLTIIGDPRSIRELSEKYGKK
ncbi:MAG: amino acid permease [Deltaproteobacteria bacterium]|nr:amino acid permease [Deltaproteobacteria bacterium]